MYQLLTRLQSLDIGQVTSPGVDELIVGSYSGKVMSFSPVIIGNKPPGAEEAPQVRLYIYLCSCIFNIQVEEFTGSTK